MSGQARILIADDDPMFCKWKGKLLTEHGYDVDTALEPGVILDKLTEEHFDLVLLDLRFKETDGIELLKKIKEIDPDISVIMISGFGTIQSAVEAVKLGAYDFLDKEIKDEELLLKINHAIEKIRDSKELRNLKMIVSERHGFHNIVGKNKLMQEVYELINTVCTTDTTILIRGETGTGKELVARAIHFNCPRKGGPFIPINCAAITETLMESELFGHEKGAFTGAYKMRIGKIEDANGGTLFLDEIGDMNLALQAKILRVIQDKSFQRVGGNKTLTSDVRIIVATNKDLEDMIKKATFREDLYYRINVMQINMPPLRERLDDLPLLIEHFINQSNKNLNKDIKGIDEGGRGLLAFYNWPGNVRELENLVERLVLMAKPGNYINRDGIAKCLPQKKVPGIEHIDTTKTLKEVEEDIEKRYLETLLQLCSGNVSKVANMSGLDRKTIYLKMSRYGLHKGDFKQDKSHHII